jgi:hypothetical protein
MHTNQGPSALDTNVKFLPSCFFETRRFLGSGIPVFAQVEDLLACKIPSNHLLMLGVKGESCVDQNLVLTLPLFLALSHRCGLGRLCVDSR